ncbi:MAG: cupredoxin domain-containing protein [Anaerolineales bacterium]|nr:cupredoxin domain-containing protein [Anaerolineales bacterium]
MSHRKLISVLFTALFLSACGAQAAAPSADIAVDLQDFAFAPTSITVPANQPVTIAFTNSGTQEHDFVIQQIPVTDVEMEGAPASQDHHMMMGSDAAEYDLHMPTAAGAASKLSFIATQPGTYKIFCSVPGHEAAGMVGELIVTQ